MELSRRGFMATALAGIAAATLSNPLVAAATDPHIENIKTLIQLHDEIIAMHEPKVLVPSKFGGADRAKRPDLLPQFTRDDVNVKMDELLGLLYTRFEPPESVTDEEYIAIHNDLEALFRGDLDGQLFRNIPPIHIPLVIGTAAIRSLLNTNNIGFDPKDCPNFSNVARTYVPFLRSRRVS